MNAQLKTVLLTVLTLSVFTIALVEVSGVSQRALFNKYGIGKETGHSTELDERNDREKLVSKLPKTKMVFPEDKFNFGKIKEGAKVQHAFKFKNLGENPLMISDAIASCGCTVPSFSKEPILPGGEGEILVEFNSAGRKGHQSKSVIIVSNADREKIAVSFEAEVE